MCIRDRVTINKSYQRLHGEDVITTPKTKKSNRTIKMPHFLCEETVSYTHLDVYKRQTRDNLAKFERCCGYLPALVEGSDPKTITDIGKGDKCTYCLLYTSRCV